LLLASLFVRFDQLARAGVGDLVHVIPRTVALGLGVTMCRPPEGVALRNYPADFVRAQERKLAGEHGAG